MSVIPFPNTLTVAHWLADTPLRPVWIRSPGRMQNTFANEAFLDELAIAAKADPFEFRIPYLDDPRREEVLKRLQSLAKWQGRASRQRVAAGTATGRAGLDTATGRGVAYVKYELIRTYVGKARIGRLPEQPGREGHSMTNTGSRPWSPGRIALIALPFSIICGFARAGDIAPIARNPVPASNVSATADMYFRLHAEVRAAATTIALPGREMTDGAAMRPMSDCAGRTTATVIRRKSVPYRLQSASTNTADAVGPALFTRTP